MNGVRVLRSGATSQDGVPVGMTFFMGSVCLLAAIGDVRMLLKRGVLGAKRVARHLWRMCFGLFIARVLFLRILKPPTEIGFGSGNQPTPVSSSVQDRFILSSQHTPTSSADFLALPGPLHKFCDAYSIALGQSWELAARVFIVCSPHIGRVRSRSGGSSELTYVSLRPVAAPYRLFGGGFQSAAPTSGLGQDIFPPC